jgi:hypothetical protein
VGSLLAGPAETIARGRLYRKRLGGGMRQAGVLAAAALVALEESPAKLAQDHENARFLAERLSQIPGIHADAGAVETNIVIFDVSETGLPSADISARLRERGVLINSINERQMRAVTHYDVDRAGCEQALATFEDILGRGTPALRRGSVANTICTDRVRRIVTRRQPALFRGRHFEDVIILLCVRRKSYRARQRNQNSLTDSRVGPYDAPCTVRWETYIQLPLRFR